MGCFNDKVVLSYFHPHPELLEVYSEISREEGTE